MDVLLLVLNTLLQVLLFAYLGIILLWSSGAAYYDVGQRGFTGYTCLILWLAASLAALIFVKPFWMAVLIVSAGVILMGIRSMLMRPSHDREWDPNFAQLPKFIIDDDELTVLNVRNTKYQTLEEYDAKFETRKYRLSDLRAVDMLLLYWGSDSVSHPMAIFDFGNSNHLCISIEVRYRKNEEYEMLRSFYRQNELMYVISDERDAILRRSKYSENHDCYLYRIQNNSKENLELLMDYIRETNSIYESPRWYNVITANCTTMIYRQRRGKIQWDSRLLINGKLDELVYERGKFTHELPFAELKQKSLINDRANSAELASFSQEIRDGLPGFE